MLDFLPQSSYFEANVQQVLRRIRSIGGRMADENNGMAKGMLIGFLAGGVVGAVIALLYAPKSGKELRKDIKEKVNDIKEDVADNLKLARSKAVDVMNDGKQRSARLVSETKEKAEHILDDANKMLSVARERAGDEQGRVKAAFRAGMDAYKNEKSKS
jgi:gas vesicle protein